MRCRQGRDAGFALLRSRLPGLVEPSRKESRAKQQRGMTTATKAGVVTAAPTGCCRFRRNKDGICRQKSNGFGVRSDRRANIALVLYADGGERVVTRRSRRAVSRLAVVVSGFQRRSAVGNMPLLIRNIPVGTTVHWC